MQHDPNPFRKASPVDFSQVVELINRLLSAIKPGLAIPDSVTDEAGLETAISVFMASLGSMKAPAVAMSLRGLRRRLPTKARTKAQSSDTATLLRSVGMTEEAISRQRKRLGY